MEITLAQAEKYFGLEVIDMSPMVHWVDGFVDGVQDGKVRVRVPEKRWLAPAGKVDPEHVVLCHARNCMAAPQDLAFFAWMHGERSNETDAAWFYKGAIQSGTLDLKTGRITYGSPWIVRPYAVTEGAD